jgi:hypothetical protein
LDYCKILVEEYLNRRRKANMNVYNPKDVPDKIISEMDGDNSVLWKRVTEERKKERNSLSKISFL